MSIFGKPPTRQPDKPFHLSQQNGEQIDAVRSKIASLMDGATESHEPASTKPSAPEEATATPTAAIQSSADKSSQTGHNRPADNDNWPAVDRWPRRADWDTTPVSENGQERLDVPPADYVEERPWPRTTRSESDPSRDFSSHVSPPVNNDSTPVEANRWSNLPDRSFIPEEEHRSNSHHALHEQRVPEYASAPETPSATAPIHIKGRAGGILIEIGNGQWSYLMAALSERLIGAGNFFRNGAVTLDLAARPLTEAELHQLHKLLTDQSLTLALVRTISEETFQVALDMGLSAQLETSTGEPTASAQSAQSNLSHEPHFVYAGHLRAGQVLQRQEHILVIGDVNPGATVISNGDILVWGHLRGLAHAGAGGDIRAVIAALNLAAVQLRISDYVAIAPEPAPKRRWGRQVAPVKQAEVAYINGDRIVVDPWDGTKFGGIAALRQ